MKHKVGIAGTIMALMTLAAHAQLSSYTSMAVPGSHNGWSTTPTMVKKADYTWVGTQTLATANGEFKFAANNGWTNNWGGNFTVQHPPAWNVGSLGPSHAANISYFDITPGQYVFTFYEQTLAFDMAPLTAAAEPNAVQIIGSFNGDGATPVGTMTNVATDTWETTFEMENGADFLVKVTSSSGSTTRGALLPATITTVPFTNGNPAAASRYTLDTSSGLYQFTYNSKSNLFDIIRIRTNAFLLSSVSAVGSFVAGNPPDVNLEKVGDTLWQADFVVTNTSNFTLSFIGRDSSGDIGRYWGLDAAASTNHPASGYMLSSDENALADLTVNSVQPGNYRIALDTRSGAYFIQQRYRIPGPINLVTNPSFENVSGGIPAGWGVFHATSGDFADFGARSGSRCGVLMRKTDENDWDLGNFDQTTATLPINSSGSLFRVSAALRTKGDWQADLVRVIIEWKDGDTTIGEAAVEATELSERWTVHIVETTVPRDGLAAKILIKYDGDPGTGFLLVDDVEARFAASRAQNFDSWGKFNSFQRINPDWEATSGKAILNRQASSPTGGVVISKYIEGTGNNKAIEIYNGTGSDIDLGEANYALYQYNNGSSSISATIPLTGTLRAGETLVVGRPDGPAAYAPNPTIKNSPNFLPHKDLTFNGDDVIVLRKGAPNSQPIDRVGRTGGHNLPGSLLASFMTDHTLHRKPHILWGNTTATGGAFSLGDWDIHPKDTFLELGYHFFAIDDPNAPYIPTGYCLMLNTNAALISPEFDDGIGDISFYARVEGSGSGSDITLVLETATSLVLTNWTPLDTFTLPVTQTNFQRFSTFTSQPDQSVLRIRHVADGTTNRVCLDDVLVEQAYLVRRSENFNEWTNYLGAPIGAYTRSEWSIRSGTVGLGPRESPSAFIYPDAGAVTTPTFESGVGNLSFTLGNIVGEFGEVRAEIHTSTNNWATWVTNDTVGFVGHAASNITATFNVSVFLPGKAAARISANGSPHPFAVDNVRVDIPAVSRTLTFNELTPTTTPSYKTFIQDGWDCTDVSIVADAGLASGNAGLMRNGIIISPYIEDMGAISFTYKLSEFSGDDTSRLKVELSPNGQTWTTIAAALTPPANAQEYYYFNTNANFHYLRITQTTSGRRILIDDINIRQPAPLPSCSITAGLSPSAPAPNEGFHLVAEVIAQNGADILSVTGRYRIAAGGWRATNLVRTGFSTFSTEHLLPPQSAGTKVTFYATVTYAGPGAAPGSSTYTTNTIFSTTNVITIMSVKKGTVWINEIFYAPYEDEEGGGGIWGDTPYNHEFVEICGVAGTQIGGWQLELLLASASDIAKNGGVARYATYTIPANTAISNTADGYGFYVIGDQELLDDGEKVNQVLTTLVPAAVNPYAAGDLDHIRDPSGIIRLLDDRTNIVYSLSYGAYSSGSDRLPVSQDPTGFNTNSLSITGNGSKYGDFTWGEGALTIGDPNTGQILTPEQGLPLMPAWHDPEALAQTQLQGIFHLIDPSPAVQSRALFIHYGYSYLEFPTYSALGGKLHYRKQGEATWSTQNKITDFPGNYDTNDSGYAYAQMAPIPAYTYHRLDTLEYVIEVPPYSGSGYDTAYLGVDIDGVSAAYETLEEAKLYPFRYTFPIGDTIEITRMAYTPTNMLFETDGNDTIDPILRFQIRSTTSLTNPTADWDIISTLTNARTNEQNYITIPRPAGPNRFFAVEPLWP